MSYNLLWLYKNLNFNYYFDNNIITTSHCEKILGVIIDNKLSFKEHIYDCVNRASKICNIIFANIKQVNNSIVEFYTFNCDKQYFRERRSLFSLRFNLHASSAMPNVEF